MKKIIVNDCAQYFTALKEIKKGIKAQILDYDEDEEIQTVIFVHIGNDGCCLQQ